MSFIPGDKVIVNGGTIAEIHTWDEENDRAVWVSKEGGANNVTYDHISTNRFEYFPSLPDVAFTPADFTPQELRDGVTNVGDADQPELPL